ncbi:MAG TPA: glutamate racemase [Steroidobacter sp.]|nr:glutamate racemase [Steroidobacteraceae bacterium]HLS81204.1 glutamate racemase [Steroidobacter sp.]
MSRRNGAAAAKPIGVFDSGVGGLTVLRALRAALPHEHFIYLGDTARLPYGTKSPETVLKYSVQAAQLLAGRGVKHVVIACNTASAVALETLRERLSVPVIGVVEPGAQAACAASRSGCIAVLATEGVVRGGAYQRAIARLRPEAKVYARACSVFVALAEEGWTHGAVAQLAAHRYLDDLAQHDPAPDTLLLGCTHFPVLADTLHRVVGDHVEIVDSARTTAAALVQELTARGLRNESTTPGSVALLATDGAERFAAVGARFLNEHVDAAQVELVDLRM